MGYRRIAIGADAPDAVTVGIERDADGAPVAAVWWPSRGDADADEVRCASVAEAFEKAAAVKDLYGFAEIVVALHPDIAWQPEWGVLDADPIQLSDEEALELARATEASRDA